MVLGNPNPGKGIGRATAMLLAKEGCKKLTITDMNAKGLEETKAEILKTCSPIELEAVSINLTDEKAVVNLFDGIIKKFGRLDYCANVAGIVRIGSTTECTTEEFDFTYRVDLQALFFCERSELKAMLKQEFLTTK
jgi:NAD(P)-dependent dehydrogenase (short-subunit alcohol dehydrogenase family)